MCAFSLPYQIVTAHVLLLSPIVKRKKIIFLEWVLFFPGVYLTNFFRTKLWKEKWKINYLKSQIIPDLKKKLNKVKLLKGKPTKKLNKSSKPHNSWNWLIENQLASFELKWKIIMWSFPSKHQRPNPLF